VDDGRTVSGPTPDELATLQELQAADDAVRRLEHQLAGLPEQRRLTELEQRDADLAAEEAEVAARLAAAQREQRQVEEEIDGLTRRRDEERVRLYDGSLTHVREIQAAEAEIASTEQRRGEHEDQLLEVMERVEDVTAELAAVHATRADLADALTAARAARDAVAGELGDRIVGARAARVPVADRLPSALVARYEAAAARGGGTGLGVLRDGACTACRLTFSGLELNALLMGPALTECPQCRRLLVVPD
jgi:predicted  nucleic acid-binding Zn-ribbon protein